MFDRFRRKKPKVFPYGEEWITVPFRIAEAARVSIYTIGSSPQISEPVRWWIAKWLSDYNAAMTVYMEETYGPDIFPLLDKITMDLMPAAEYSESSPENDEPHGYSWDMWERELNEGDAGK